MNCIFVDEKESAKTKMHEWGKHAFADGSVYEGNLKNGFPQGEGKCTFDDGSVYEGNWRDGVVHGEGKCTSADGGTV
jgi:hypothetical protein